MVVNDIIVEIGKKDEKLVKLPEGGCYDPRFHNMNMREAYRILKDECKNPKKPEGDNPRKGRGSGVVKRKIAMAMAMVTTGDTMSMSSMTMRSVRWTLTKPRRSTIV